MLLSYYELLKLIEDGVVQNCPSALVNQSSIDVTLGSFVLREIQEYKRSEHRFNEAITIASKQPLYTDKVDISDGGYTLMPGEFILAQTEQIFHLPNNISAKFELKSSPARVGLNNMLAGWCDAGWNGSVLTLELVNNTKYTPLVLQKGDRIGQMVFFKHTPIPTHASYAVKGRYNGDNNVSGAKPDKERV